MPTILTNTQQAGRPGQPQNAIGLPDGRILEAGASLQYDEWDDIKDRPNIAHYVDNGLIEVGKGKLKAAEVAEVAENAAEANKHAEAATDGANTAAASANTARNTGSRNSR